MQGTGFALFTVVFALLSAAGAFALYSVIDAETSNPRVVEREEAESIAREEAERRARNLGRREE
ncbi:hypothetical protein [Halopelagius longus]|uniref:Uncharacterized protein n=1 Tax=Halopelagius longus TaxID=1236180 RepID=A0A1H1DKX7_9EURY|nr:hypothetical protein [Halopelagius longus]RDI71367.1 hypothetical protein DWB78_06285 [Halopelagius longus]SDQ76889.1 hypothetical protein SAMN05216278_2455 [Halopelagius longus]